jgi:putative acetyltransferase
MPAELILRAVSPFDAAVSNMIGDLDRYLLDLYPPDSSYRDSLQTLSEANCKLLGAYRNGELIGIGAAKLMDGYGELKRFYTPEAFRGQGVAECLIGALERWLFENGVEHARLETGVHQHAAIRFYRKMGYEPCERFGEYRADPLCVFMAKNLNHAE